MHWSILAAAVALAISFMQLGAMSVWVSVLLLVLKAVLLVAHRCSRRWHLDGPLAAISVALPCNPAVAHPGFSVKRHRAYGSGRKAEFANEDLEGYRVSRRRRRPSSYGRTPPPLSLGQVVRWSVAIHACNPKKRNEVFRGPIRDTCNTGPIPTLPNSLAVQPTSKKAKPPVIAMTVALATASALCLAFPSTRLFGVGGIALLTYLHPLSLAAACPCRSRRCCLPYLSTEVLRCITKS